MPPTQDIEIHDVHVVGSREDVANVVAADETGTTSNE